MIDSFQSDGGTRPHGRGKHVSWTRESPVKENGGRRGPLVDDPPEYYTIDDERTTAYTSRWLQLAGHGRDTSLRSSAVSATASRRHANIVFLAIFPSFSLSPYPAIRRRAGPEGRVLTISPGHTMVIPDMSPASSLSTPPTPMSFVSSPDAALWVSDNETYISAGEGSQRFVGRVSAWTCTTPYVTSRLPQIWKSVRSYLLFPRFLLTFVFFRKIVKVIGSP